MSNYTPVSCELQDQLEAIATLKQECQITFHNEEGRAIETQGAIVDIYAANGVDWCKLGNDMVIRLDKIESFKRL